MLTVAKETTTLPLKNGEYDDQTLAEHLKKAKEKYPNKVDGALAMTDDLPYERLIRSMDQFLKAGFSSVSILTGGPK